MEFTLAFGAVGDFIAVIALIKDIVTALDDSRGSTKDYRDLVQELDILGKTVQQVNQIFDDVEITKDLNDLTILAVSSAGQIQRCLESFRDRNRKFERSLGVGGGAKNILQGVTRKIQWRFEEKDVTKFRDELKGYTASLGMLLEVTAIRLTLRNHEARNTQAADAEQRTSSRIGRSTQILKQYVGTIGQRIISKLGFIAGIGLELQKSTSDLTTMMITLSSDLGGLRNILMRLERPLNDEHFILEDITGRVFPVHLKAITSWDALEYILADRFRGRRGARRVKGKQYSLQERGTQRQVDRSVDWEYAFLPYQRIDMSLRCLDAQVSSENSSCVNCPFCQTTSPGEAGTEIQCLKCNMFFRRVVEKDELEAQSQDATPLTPHIKSPPSHNPSIRFGQPSFGPERPKRRRSATSVISGAKLKRRRSQHGLKRKFQDDEGNSDSDDEDFRGFIRVTLIAKRRRTTWFTSDQAEPFSSVAQRVLGGSTSPQATRSVIRKEASDHLLGTAVTKVAARHALSASAFMVHKSFFRDNKTGDIASISDSEDASADETNTLEYATCQLGDKSIFIADPSRGADPQPYCQFDINTPKLQNEAPFELEPTLAEETNFDFIPNVEWETESFVTEFRALPVNESYGCGGSYNLPTDQSSDPKLRVYGKDCQAGSFDRQGNNFDPNMSVEAYPILRKIGAIVCRMIVHQYLREKGYGGTSSR